MNVKRLKYFKQFDFEDNSNFMHPDIKLQKSQYYTNGTYKGYIY